MAKTGRKPKPKPGDMAVVANMPEKPGWLSKPAQTIWDRIAPMLAELELLANVDEDLLANYCDSAATYRECGVLEKKHGLLIEDTGGSFKANPATRAKQNAFDRMMRIGGTMGLNPVARTQLKRCGLDGNASITKKKQSDLEKQKDSVEVKRLSYFTA